MPEFVNDILGIFLGALLGIPAGIWLNSIKKNRADKTRKEQLKSAIKESVKKNVGLLKQIEEWITNPGGTPFFNVDLPLLESTANLKYEILHDINLCREIDHFRYELTHLSRKIDLLLGLEFDSSARNVKDTPQGLTSMYSLLRPDLVKAIHSHIQPIQDTADGILKVL